MLIASNNTLDRQ